MVQYAPNHHPKYYSKNASVPICTLGRTHISPEPSGPSASPPAPTIAHIVVSAPVAVACPDSVGGPRNSLGTDTEHILPALAEAVHDELDVFLGPEGTDDSPDRPNIRPDATTDGGFDAPLPAAARATAECLDQAASDTNFAEFWTKFVDAM